MFLDQKKSAGCHEQHPAKVGILYRYFCIEAKSFFIIPTPQLRNLKFSRLHLTKERQSTVPFRQTLKYYFMYFFSVQNGFLS